MARSYTYAHRVAKSAAEGWTDPRGKVNAYTFRRKVDEYARDSEIYADNLDEVDDTPEARRALYTAFKVAEKDDYSTYRKNGKYGYDPVTGKGAKAWLFVKVLGLVGSFAEWERLYPTKTRFGHLLQGDTASVSGPEIPRKNARFVKRRRIGERRP